MVLGKMPEKGSGGSIDRFRKRLCGQRDFLEFEIIETRMSKDQTRHVRLYGEVKLSRVEHDQFLPREIFLFMNFVWIYNKSFALNLSEADFLCREQSGWMC